MKKILFFLMFSALAAAQVSPPSTQSRVAGRFVAYNYGVWSLPVYTMPSGTGSQTFTLSNSTARLQDGRVIMPFAVNAPLRVGSETVTVTAVGAGCIINSTVIGGCSITATFTLPHTVADPVASGTWGLQEALNDAAASGGGTVTVDSAWTARGGTSGMVSAATIPSSTGIEDERTGPGSGSYPGVTSDGAGGLNVTGTVAAGTATPTTIGSSGVLLNGVPALQSQTSLNNYYSGGAGNLTGTGSSNTANGFEALYSNSTGNYNTANGFEALYSNSTGNYNTANGFRALNANTTGSYNTANGFEALNANTTGNNNTANGYAALYANTTGSSNTANGFEALNANTTGTSNTANGMYALNANTTGTSNTANGMYALNANTTGNNNTANGFQAGEHIADGVTANQTSSNSVYEGFQAYPLASGDTNENVIGNTAIGHGSNTTTLGNTATVGTWLNGTQHITATAPTASAGTIAAYSTNAGGEITGLSAATSVTITFANSGWTNAAFCTANASTTLATNVYNSAQSNTAVTFTFPSLTGNLFYHCDGN
jgi:hypothetical protein